jgi:DNA-binding NarL/FixJ family response regulator
VTSDWVAPILPAMVRCADGGIMRSSVVTRYQLGLVRQEASVIAPAGAATFHGASGESSRWRDLAPRDQLTAQELQIARLAAQGLSNRDIAQRLYLSHRTIGTHLYRIFPKLGITSRGELSSALSARTAWPER